MGCGVQREVLLCPVNVGVRGLWDAEEAAAVPGGCRGNERWGAEGWDNRDVGCAGLG